MAFSNTLKICNISIKDGTMFEHNQDNKGETICDKFVKSVHYEAINKYEYILNNK